MRGSGLIAGFMLVLLGLVGGRYEFTTLGLAVCIAAVDLLFDLARRRPLAVRLVDVWRLAFVYLYGSEVLLSLGDVRQDFGPGVTATAEGFLVASFGASLAGYAMARRLLPLRRRGAREAAPRVATRLSPTGLLLLSTAILIYIVTAVSPEQLATVRSMRDSMFGPEFLGVVAAMIVQCALTARAVVVSRRRSAYVYPCVVAVLSLVVLYGVGTRFFLGFALSGVLFFAARLMEPVSPRRLVVFGIALLGLVMLQGTMRMVRGIGMAETRVDDVVASLARPDAVLSSEGMVRVHAWVHQKRLYADNARLPELAFVLYWWVPRAIWPSKPTMDGYWIAHEVMAEGDVGPGHSVAGGFALPVLLDFGPDPGVAFCLLVGAALWGLERFTAMHRNPADPASVFAALLPFGVFFSMRSPQTSAILLESCVAVYAPIFLLGRVRRARRRRVLVPRVPERAVSHATA
jgi:hypothetical protein